MPSFTRKDENGSLVELTVSNRTIIRIAIVILGLLAFVWGVDHARHSILLIFTSFFLALALNAPVQFIARHLPGKLRGSRSLGTTISYLIVLIIIGSFLAYLVPPLVRQTENFVAAAPKLVSEFRNQSGEVGTFIRRYHLQKEVTKLSSQLSARLHDIGGRAFSTVIDIGKSIFSLLTVIVLTFMMLVEGPVWVRFARDIVPDNRHKIVDRISADMYKVVKGYVNGQVLLAAIAAVCITPALYALHIGYPVALIAVIFICGLIPLVGHSFGAVIVTIVALFHSLTSGIIILIYYILYQQLENYLIQPKLQANTTKMSPLLVFASLVVGINFAGLFGGLIAIPVAACIKILLLEILRSRNIISSAKFEEATTKDSTDPTTATAGR